MLSLILDFIMAVLLARFVFWIARLLLTSGRPDDGAAGRGGPGDATWGPGDGGSGRSRHHPSIDRSSAIDVPFTEIPPEGSDHDPSARSAAGDR